MTIKYVVDTQCHKTNGTEAKIQGDNVDMFVTICGRPVHTPRIADAPYSAFPMCAECVAGTLLPATVRKRLWGTPMPPTP